MWDAKQITPAITMEGSVKQITQWRETRKKHLVSGNVSSGQVQEVKWCAPTKGRLKVNVDASVIHGEESFPVDMIIRDHFGKFIQAKNL